MTDNRNYSRDKNTLENINSDDKYSVTGESEFTRDSTIPFDQDEVLTERHYNLGSLESSGHTRSKVYKNQKAAAPSEFSKSRGRGPQGHRRSDETVREDVSEALYRSTSVDASDITVSVKSGIVTIKGFVDDIEQKEAAELAVRNLAGVDEIYNDLVARSSIKENKKPKYGLMNNITGLN